MYGREANSAQLLEHLPFSEDEDDDSAICPDLDNQENDWINPLMETRAESKDKLMTTSNSSKLNKNVYSITRSRKTGKSI